MGKSINSAGPGIILHCDVCRWTNELKRAMATEKKKKRGGKYCVCGGPGGFSCMNSAHTPSISLHKFPNEETKPGEHKLWTKFVRRHRPNFTPTIYSVICSAHFEPSCYPSRYSFDIPSSVKPRSTYLNPGSIPTLDAVVPLDTSTPLSARERRKNVRELVSRSNVSCSKTKLEYDSESEAGSSTFNVETFTLPRSQEQEEIQPGQDIQGEEVVAEQESASAADTGSTSALSCETCQTNKDKVQSLQKSKWKMKRQLDNKKDEIKYLKSEIKQLNKLLAEASKDSASEDEGLSSNGGDDVGSCGVCESDMDLDEDVEEAEDDNSEVDPDWEEKEVSDDEVEDDSQECASERDVRVEPGTSVTEEPKFIVFYTMLMSLFTMFCYKCKAEGPSVSMKVHGTMATVLQQCSKCGENYKWHSQPLVLGRYPAGNILLSFAVLMAGASISKVLLLFKHMGLAAYSTRTFFYHQTKFVFPVILKHWEIYRAGLIEKIKGIADVSWCGDGRFDSMGHSAKYGAYSMLCCNISKIVYFEILQANETGGSSNAMELAGAQRCFAYLKQLGVAIKVFISDRHRGIASWIRLSEKGTKHFFDIWHIAKSIIKQVIQGSKEKGCGALKDWTQAIKTHLYWCAMSTTPGFGDLMVSKWKSFMRHVCNKHTHHEDDLYKQCAHGELPQKRKWIKYCSKAYEKLRGILHKTGIINDIRNMSSQAQTSCLEGFHSTLNHWHPKMLSFSWMGTYCRHIMACLHFNENTGREAKKTKEGKPYIKVTYPKYKLGDELVRHIATQPTYGYVSDLKKRLFTMPVAQMKEVYDAYKRKAPQPLTAQFTDRRGRKDAIHRQEKRRKIVTELLPSVSEQEQLQASQKEKAAARALRKRKAPTCKKCGRPRKGHSKAECKSPSTSHE